MWKHKSKKRRFTDAFFTAAALDGMIHQKRSKTAAFIPKVKGPTERGLFKGIVA